MNNEKQAFLTTLLEYPEESSLTEYKSALPFDPKTEFGVKLVKHILGMANTGGGYIIIGFREQTEGRLVPDSALTDVVSKSYETTKLCQSVDSFLSPGQRIQLQVLKVQHGDKNYPVISIEGFSDTPFFCGKDYFDSRSKLILREGAPYIRDAAAKTVSIATPEHWNAILNRAVQRRQTALLEQLRSLLSEAGLASPVVSRMRQTNHTVDNERV